MILSDGEIRAALARGAINITPRPADDAWTSTAIDLRLAKELVEWKKDHDPAVDTSICPSVKGYNFDKIKANFCKTVQMDGFYILEPNSFILGWTAEKIKLPSRSRLAARVEGKSSLARLGVGVHVTAPTIHAGFGDKAGDANYAGSPLQLEIWNVGPLKIKLLPNMAICQIIFEIVDGTPSKGYAGAFSIQGPDDPKPPQQK